MMYEMMYELACYASKNWRGKFTPKEIACMAYGNLCELEASAIRKEPTVSIKCLLQNLKEDINNGSEEAQFFYDAIMERIHK